MTLFAALLALVPAEPAKVRKILIDFPGWVPFVAFTPDGKTLATSGHASQGDNNAVRLWDIASGKEICCLGNYHPGGGAMVIAPDGKTLITVRSATALDCWDLPTRKLRLTIKAKRGVPLALAVSPDSKLLAAGGLAERATVWDLRTGKQVSWIGPEYEPGCSGPAVTFTCLAFSPDGKTLAAASNGGPVTVWDVATGKELHVLRRHKKKANFVAFAPDGKTLYSLGEDRVLVYWDPATGKARREIDLTQQKRIWTKRAALASDGKTLAIQGYGQVCLFDLASGKYWPGVEWDYQGSHHRSVAFSADGKLLASGGGGQKAHNNVYIYEVPQRKPKARD
jgi:WD40 repeat protein